MRRALQLYRAQFKLSTTKNPDSVQDNAPESLPSETSLNQGAEILLSFARVKHLMLKVIFTLDYHIFGKNRTIDVSMSFKCLIL